MTNLGPSTGDQELDSLEAEVASHLIAIERVPDRIRAGAIDLFALRRVDETFAEWATASRAVRTNTTGSAYAVVNLGSVEVTLTERDGSVVGTAVGEVNELAIEWSDGSSQSIVPNEDNTFVLERNKPFRVRVFLADETSVVSRLFPPVGEDS